MKTRIVFLLAWILGLAALGQEIRPVCDNVGFCWNMADMHKLVRKLAELEKSSFPANGLVAALAPHDDYLYAGRVYYPLFKMLRCREAVIFGVTHGTVRKEIGDVQNILIFDDYVKWPGLGHPVAVSPLREYLKAKLPLGSFATNNRAHELEHSIEALLPFLQYYNPDVRVTPIMVTAMPLARMEEIATSLADVVAAYMKEKGLTPGRDIFFLVSSDGNHYGKDFNNTPFGEDEAAHQKALAIDRRLISDYLEGHPGPEKIAELTAELWGKGERAPQSTYWCGRYSIPFGLLASEKIMARTAGRPLRGKLLRFADTCSGGFLPLRGTKLGTTAPFSLKHWVSFFSVGYYLEKGPPR